MDRRRTERAKLRAPCALALDGRRHNGFVLDISLSGLFIQTSAKPELGQRLDVELVLGGKTLPMHVEVARRRNVPPQLLTVAHGGIGARILSAPEEFYQLLSEVQGIEGGAPGARAEAGRPSAKGASSPDDTSAPSSDLPQFRVRVVNGSRSRAVRVHCEAQDEAGAQALEQLGDGWKVLEVESLDPS